jgi:hypothetical protein
MKKIKTLIILRTRFHFTCFNTKKDVTPFYIYHDLFLKEKDFVIINVMNGRTNDDTLKVILDGYDTWGWKNHKKLLTKFIINNTKDNNP